MYTSTTRTKGIAHALVILSLLVGFIALPVPPLYAFGSTISLTTLGSTYTQDFDSLSNTAESTTNVLSITGWELTESGGSVSRDNEQYGVDTGMSNTGDTYSYGASGSTDRALGSLRSGTLISSFGAAFTNDTGSAIRKVEIAYTGEEWRLGSVSRTDKLAFEYSTNATDLTSGTWIAVPDLDFITPEITATGAKNGNDLTNRSALSATISGLNIPDGATFAIRWLDTDASGADDGLAIDDFSLTPQDDTSINLSVNDVSMSEGNSGTTTFTFSISLSNPADVGGVTFDMATADNTATAPSDYSAKSLTGQTIDAGDDSYTFTVLVNGDTTAESNETFFVNVTNVTGATVADGQGQGTILNDDLVPIHMVQGSGSSSPWVGNTAIVEGIVIANFQGSNRLQGFFLQEADSNADADPNTSEGIFVYCGSCATVVTEGQYVRASGAVLEFNGLTEISATSAGAVTVLDPSNHLGDVTATTIALPITGDVDSFYEARESMLVTFPDTLTVSEYFELARFGQVELYADGRPAQFTETNTPSVAGYNAHLDDLARRRVILDDDNNAQEAYLAQADGSQRIFYPQANGGFSVGVQGTDFFRGGDEVHNLTGVLHWSYPGFGDNTWRIRPTATHPVEFTVANARPSVPPTVGGTIKAVGMNLLNYFTTIDTTASDSSGTCGPAHTLDCRGADSSAELNRQRERASIVVCDLNADVYAFMELENTTAHDTILDLLDAVNARCGSSHPYTYVNTGSTLGSDAIRVIIIYRIGILSPVGSPLVDLDSINNRPPTAQTFNVVDTSNPAFGERFTVIANHLKSKGCPGTGGDADAGDGQGCYNSTRTAQANRLLTWINSTVLPAAGDSDVLLLGDFNSYAQEDPVSTITGGGYTDLASALLGDSSYSYVFDGQLGHLDYAFASSSLAAKVAGIGNWHINADEATLFDYNDEIADTGEASFDAKPDGSALIPPRVVYAAGTPYRASDHDPVVVGLFPSVHVPVSITNITSSKTDAAYTTGTLIPISITFSDNVMVTGNPQLALETGASDALATYASGSGSNTLIFNYTVQAGDISSDLDYVNTSSLILNGGTIKDATSTDADLTLPAPSAPGSLGANKSLVIDTIAPTTLIDSQPNPITNDSNAIFTFHADDGSGVGGGDLECALDDTAFSVCTSPLNYNNLSAGNHTFQVRASDSLGNTSSTPTSYTWAIDTQAPSVTINQAGSQTDPTASSPIYFQVIFSEAVTGFTSSDVVLSGTAHPSSAVVTGGPTIYTIAVSGMDGSGTVIATIPEHVAADAAGNSNSAAQSSDNTVVFDSGTIPHTVYVPLATKTASVTQRQNVHMALTRRVYQ